MTNKKTDSKPALLQQLVDELISAAHDARSGDGNAPDEEHMLRGSFVGALGMYGPEVEEAAGRLLSLLGAHEFDGASD